MEGAYLFEISSVSQCSRTCGHGYVVRGSHLSQPGNFRPPDIGWCKDVRFGRRSGSLGSRRGSGALERRAGKGKPDTRWRTHGEAQPQARAGEDCRRLVEDRTECLGACVRCGELSGAKVIFSSLSETRMSPAVANSSCSRVRPS